MKPKRPIDAAEIFNHALRFSSADVFLRSGKGDSLFTMTIAAPSMVLSSFAIELLLKCLLVKTTGQAPETHHLGVLFRQIGHKHKRRIEELWDAGPRRKLDPWCKQLGHPVDLPNAINKCARAFEDLRYVYEDPDRVIYYLVELPELLIDYIVELEPSWRPIQLNRPTSPIGQRR